MERNREPQAFRKPKITRRGVIAAALALIVAVAGVAGVASLLRKQLRQETAVRYTESVNLEMDAFIVRAETPVVASGQGFAPVVSDGQRVRQGENIAYNFSDKKASENMARMLEIQSLLEYYNSLKGASSATSSISQNMESRLFTRLCAHAAMAASGNYTAMQSDVSGLRDITATVQLAKGVQFDLTAKIQALTQEYNSLKGAVTGYTSLKAEQAGTFLSGSDGLETQLTPADLSAITPQQIDDALSAQESSESNVIGRIMTSHEWYIVGNLSFGEGKDIHEGSDYLVTFPYAASESIETTVYRVVRDQQSNRTAVVLRTKYMNEDLARLRKEVVSIRIQTFDGLKVLSSAIYRDPDNNKQAYVYALVDGFIRKRSVVRAAETGDYTVVKLRDQLTDEDFEQVGDASYLRPFDTYIVGGRNLHDGDRIY